MVVTLPYFNPLLTCYTSNNGKGRHYLIPRWPRAQAPFYLPSHRSGADRSVRVQPLICHSQNKIVRCAIFFVLMNDKMYSKR